MKALVLATVFSPIAHPQAGGRDDGRRATGGGASAGVRLHDLPAILFRLRAAPARGTHQATQQLCPTATARRKAYSAGWQTWRRFRARAEKAIEQREPAVIYFLLLPIAKDLRRSSRWPALAKMMNLPDVF
jgi:hypothetical protein